jgi:hypothetical protein
MIEPWMCWKKWRGMLSNLDKEGLQSRSKLECDSGEDGKEDTIQTAKKVEAR